MSRQVARLGRLAVVGALMVISSFFMAYAIHWGGPGTADPGCDLTVSSLSPAAATAPAKSTVSFNLTLTANQGTWSDFSVEVTIRPTQEGFTATTSGVPTKLAAQQSAQVSVTLEVGSGVVPQAYTVHVIVGAKCHGRGGQEEITADLTVTKLEAPQTLAATTCTGDPYSSSGETCETDVDGDGVPDYSEKITCTGDESSGNYTCTGAEDDNGDGKIDRTWTETCTTSASGWSCTDAYDDDADGKIDRTETTTCTSTDVGRVCTDAYDDNGDGKIDRTDTTTCTDSGNSCFTSYDDNGDGKPDRTETTTCTQTGSGYSCTTKYDDDADGTTDRTVTETCTATAGGGYDCKTQEDDDNDGKSDHNGSQTGTSALPPSSIPPELRDPFHPRSGPESDYQPLAVVVNELAWAGTAASASDEWIELYNTTNHPIGLNGWRLVSLKPDASFQVVLKGEIPARGYFLMEQGDDNTVSDIPADLIYSGELLDGGMALILLDPDGHRVDGVNLSGGPWPGGTRIGALALSMERIDPLRGDAPQNWSTNNTVTRNGLDRMGQPINGTPKARNSVTPAGK